jgi:uncharacterized membrane protein YoaK (UPF0700 family)
MSSSQSLTHRDERVRGYLVILLAITSGSTDAIALGMQSAAIQRFGNSDLSTTYLTGTLTRVVSRLVLGSPIGDIAHSVQILCGLVFGAAAGAMLQLHAPHWAPLIQLGTLGVVLVVALTRLGHRDSSDPAS